MGLAGHIGFPLCDRAEYNFSLPRPDAGSRRLEVFVRYLILIAPWMILDSVIIAPPVCIFSSGMSGRLSILIRFRIIQA